MIGIYIRESTKEQYDKGYNAVTQKKKILQFVELYDLDDDYEIYEEKGYSAKTTKRPAMNKMKQDIKDGKLDTVIVYKLDRLFRRHESKTELLDLFKQNDVVLMCVEEKVDTTSAIGRYVLNIMVSTFELEQDIISERTNDGLVTGAEQGYFVRGGKTPFGFRKYQVGYHYKVKVHEEEANIIRKMRDYLKEGLTPFEIKMMINDDEYMKSINKTFCENQIVNILKSKINKGIMEHKGVEYSMEERIFSDKEYDEIQKMLSSRSKEAKYDYLFARKVRSVSGEVSKLKSTVKKEKVYLYYFDVDTKQRVNESILEKEALNYLKNNEVLYKKYRGKTYRADLQHLKSKKETLDRMYKDMDITTDVYITENLEIDNEMKKIKRYYQKYISNIEDYFDNLKYEDKASLIRKNIKYIEIDFAEKNIIKIC